MWFRETGVYAFITRSAMYDNAFHTFSGNWSLPTHHNGQPWRSAKYNKWQPVRTGNEIYNFFKAKESLAAVKHDCVAHSILSLDNSIILVGILTCIFKVQRTCFLSLFLEILWAFFETAFFKPTAYHSHSNTKSIKFSKTKVPKKKYYIGEYKWGWDIYIERYRTHIMPKYPARRIYGRSSPSFSWSAGTDDIQHSHQTTKGCNINYSAAHAMSTICPTPVDYSAQGKQANERFRDVMNVTTISIYAACHSNNPPDNVSTSTGANDNLSRRAWSTWIMKQNCLPKIVPFQAIGVSMTTVTTIANCVENIVFIDLTTLARRRKLNDSSVLPNTHYLTTKVEEPTISHIHPLRQHCRSTRTREDSVLINDDFLNANREYAVNTTVYYFGMCENVQNVVPWYGPSPAYDTIEAPKHILKRDQRRASPTEGLVQLCPTKSLTMCWSTFPLWVRQDDKQLMKQRHYHQSDVDPPTLDCILHSLIRKKF